MLSVQVRVDSRVGQVSAVAAARVEAIVEKAARDVEARAKAQAPVDTGFLKSSIQTSREGPATWRVEAAAEYAVFVELGTVRMGARPFLVPALESVRPQLAAALRGIV